MSIKFTNYYNVGLLRVRVLHKSVAIRNGRYLVLTVGWCGNQTDRPLAKLDEKVML